MYYIRVVTRSSGGSARGTPRQAIDYITDAHDSSRDPSYSSAELAYIARLDDGWKTDLEGGRVPLVGVGALAEITDQDALAAHFEHACQPWFDRRGTTGYKSFTFTLPKEVSLFCEGHREAAKEAIHAAVRSAIDQAFAGMEVSGVAAVHIRNEVGEIHYHVHVLIGKFARDRASGRVFSLNGQRGGNTPERIRTLKTAWKESVDREFHERLGLRIEQGRAYARPALTLEDGTRIPPLDRQSRRLLDKQLAPRYTSLSDSGALRQHVFRWTALDERIFEIAAAPKDAGGWSAQVFCELFPELSHRAGAHEARVATLKRIGYLTTDGAITPSFRLHYAARHGIDMPELQRLRADVRKREFRAAAAEKRPPSLDDLWLALHRQYDLLERARRLGVTREDLARIERKAERHRPTRENLKLIRAQVERRVLAHPPRRLPETKTIIRAFWGVQQARVRAFFLVTTGILTLRYRANRQLADRVQRAARIDLFNAKEKRLAQVARCFRPIFWATRLILPRETRRLEIALGRCSRLAARQHIDALYRQEVRAAHDRWRERYIELPRKELDTRAARFELPAQVELRPRLDSARAAIPLSAPAASVAELRHGLQVLRALRPAEASRLAAWEGREDELVARVVDQAKGRETGLPAEEYRAAVRAGRIGHLLSRESAAPTPPAPTPGAARMAEVERARARLRAFRVPDPFTKEALSSLPPKAIDSAVTALRKARLLDDGPAWTLEGRAAFTVSEQIRTTFTRALEDEKGAGR